MRGGRVNHRGEVYNPRSLPDPVENVLWRVAVDDDDAMAAPVGSGFGSPKVGSDGRMFLCPRNRGVGVEKNHEERFERSTRRAVMERLRELASRHKKELSTMARELIEQGSILVSLREYREGSLSLGNLAERLDMSIAQALDLLAELGVRSPIAYDDHLESDRATHSLVADEGDT